MLDRRTALLLATISVVAAACGSASQGEPATAFSSVLRSNPPGAGPAASPAPSAAAIRVTGLSLRADPTEAVGTCPLDITFSATITVAGHGDVAYRWRSSDGDVSPIKSVSFARSGSMTVSSSWTVDANALPTHAGWSSLELIDPPPGTPAPSAKPAEFAFTCAQDDDIEAIGFGIGGSNADCSIAKNLRTFTPDDRIRMVANYWPSLQAGTVVTFSLTLDGAVVEGYPVTATYDASTTCVYGNVSNGHLAAGHYRLTVAPNSARAVAGEFDVR